MENSLYVREDRYDEKTISELMVHYREILRLLGEDPDREGLLKTPERVAKAMAFMTKGYNEDPKQIIQSALFREDYRHMVLVKDIELYSMCEHHILPFFGKAHVAYIPNGTITGLSKIARVVECFARRLQMRGIQKQNSVTTTSAFTGTFLSDHRTREEFLNLIGHKLR